MIEEVKTILDKLDKMDENLNGRLDKVDDRLDKVDDRLDKIDDRLDKVDDRLDKIDGRLDKVDERLDKIDDRLDKVDDRLDKIDGKTTDIQMTIENEISKNIRIIAEGHLDLSKKLDEALKVENEKEILLIRVNHIENELHRVKERVELKD